MLNIPQHLATELSLKPFQVSNALELLAEGATVPFIARYRKERTGEMTETQLRELFDRYAYLTELEERKQTILQAIAQQDKLTPELQTQIENCLQKTELEDLYLPFRPKRRTRATIAREKGLEPLADWLQSLNQPGAAVKSLSEEAAKYISQEKGVATVADALKGASDILAEVVADKAVHRAYLRDYLMESGFLVSRVKGDHAEGSTRFEMYRNYRAKVKTIPPHNLLALYRGEAEDILAVELEFDEEAALAYLESREVRTKASVLRQFYREMLKDAFNRLMKTSLINEVRAAKKQEADVESIKTFEANLRELLLASPAGMKPTLAIDPGFRTGCKVAVLDQTAKFLEYQTIFPHQAANQRQEAARILVHLIQKYGIELIAIGNGTAGRETDEFVAEVLATLERQPIKVMVNEAGASVYSASPVAIAEFPDQDVTVRGAISIGRRLQDPLAELVKIDPKSIGVGQYQHDVDQKLLKKKLDETVESCVNYVGVDLNTASRELLTFVSGITPTIANNIVAYRNENGAFRDRRQLLNVAKLGPKAFEQAAGFLRIRDGNNPLDNTAVHPESYPVVEAIAADLNLPLTRISEIARQLKSTDLKKYVTENVGEPTLRDILAELEKPGRDPRAEFRYATFKAGVKEISDLQVGMELEGVVTNVANFGAFVDIGVHQDGLVHISQLADRFVSDPKQIVKVGQVVKVRVLEVNEALKRISLSMRTGDRATDLPNRNPKDRQPQSGRPPQPDRKPQPKAASLEDLQARFGKKI
ncbi:RNA-binding transcriptional accessory protein [Leptothermofonsia sichuanensis E412]|uniref:Tex family protein n=1 Tax=Leptothermofonsia sichuanensis TaxID=2917832 RepID=UPI001CA67068|nr:Tex family protein [Leptothermofonsia sichuanensis]QZZ19771.1 RNA-binding transcriptional accessory protein [Leptothermofonsia sichuanensis E412]